MSAIIIVLGPCNVELMLHVIPFFFQAMCWRGEAKGEQQWQTASVQRYERVPELSRNQSPKKRHVGYPFYASLVASLLPLKTPCWALTKEMLQALSWKGSEGVCL